MGSKINLMNDYNMPAHPDVIAAIAQVATQKYVGYGLDELSEAARTTIQTLVANPQADVHFLAGGTQANLTAIAAFLRPHESIIAPASAHINGHETGAVEATGHKILSFPSTDGKARPADIEPILAELTSEHMTKPRLLSISQATEFGTVYLLDELEALGEFCRVHDLLLYIDGARLGCALTAEGSDVTLPDLARIADAFYIGGTKNGALFGEALVITNPVLQTDFRYAMKQRGAMIAKGFLLGIQFEALLGGASEPLYFQLARQANKKAERLRVGLRELGYRVEVDAPTNQVFPIVTPQIAEALESEVLFERWGVSSADELSIRFVTTWLTTDDEVDAVLSLLAQV
jgi:threonine aldolase